MNKLNNPVFEELKKSNFLLYLIGVTVGRRPPVLQVSLPVFGHVPGYSDGAAAIGNASREIVNRRRLMETSQPTLVVFALYISSNMSS